MRKKLSLVFVSVCALVLTLSACTRYTPEEPVNEAQANGSGDGETPANGHGAGHHGPSHELGTADIGPFSVRAARDEGEVLPGGDAPIDVWLTGDYESVVAVRFWIGTEDAAGTIKARADIENPDTPNHWHTHALVPDPMPEGSMLWVEIETAEGKQTGSFDLHIGH